MGISKLISIFVIFHLVNVSKSEIRQVKPNCSNGNECRILVNQNSAEDEFQIEPHKHYAKIKKLSLHASYLIRLTNIFCKTFPSIEDFYAYYSRITIVDSDAFVGCSNLKSVNLGYNNIKSISDDLFKAIRKITVINLSQNQIKNLSGIAFQGLNDLQTLELHSNNLDEIKMKEFGVLPNLKEILLHGNQLNYISVDFTQFPKLTSLTLFRKSTRGNSQENKFPFEVKDHLFQQLSSKNISSDHACYKANTCKCPKDKNCNDYTICLKSNDAIPETTPMTKAVTPDMSDEHLSIVYTIMGINFILIRGEPIGEGWFGQIYKGTLKKQEKEETVAIKLIETTKIHEIIPEISTMLKLEHRNIVKMHDYKTDPGNDHNHIIIMEYVAKGSILKYLETLNTQDNSNFKHFLELTKDIAKGLEYLFNQKIVHRDLAARNILVTEDNHAKISDFGLARHCDVNGAYQCTSSILIPMKWYAPEAIDNKTYTKMSDIWSFGVTMYEIFSYGQAPFKDAKDTEDLKNLIRTSPLEKPDRCPVEIYEKLMLPCWKIDPEERPEISQICITIDELLL
uniref:CSON014132 protein n=1 Tax=Culicoides sonorensis TaxID=179676 RepID=A0A336MM16_CULSO